MVGTTVQFVDLERCTLLLSFISVRQPMETVLRKPKESTGVNCRNVRRRGRCP